MTIRLDTDVLDWIKGHGMGCQTRINRILRVVMKASRGGRCIPKASTS